MDPLFRELSRISTTDYLKKFFISLLSDAAKQAYNIQVIDNYIIIHGNTIDVNSYENISDLYYEIVTIINSYVQIIENWKKIKYNVKVKLLDDYYEVICNTNPYFTDLQKEKLKTLFHLILVSPNFDNNITVVNSKICNINGLYLNKDGIPYIEGIDNINLNDYIPKKKKIFTKSINKFNAAYLKKYKSTCK